MFGWLDLSIEDNVKELNLMNKTIEGGVLEDVGKKMEVDECFW